MEQDIYLYPGSQSEAHRLGEAALWDASFHANVSCARDIEAVIRVYGDGRSALKPEASQMVLKRWGFKRTNFVLANTIERLGPYKEQLSAENQEWQKKAYVPPDDAHNRYFEVDTALAYRNEVREWSIERLMEAEKNFFAKCGRLPEPYEYTAENGLPMYSVFCRLAKEAFEEIIRAQFLETQELSGPVLTM